MTDNDEKPLSAPKQAPLRDAMLYLQDAVTALFSYIQITNECSAAHCVCVTDSLITAASGRSNASASQGRLFKERRRPSGKDAKVAQGDVLAHRDGTRVAKCLPRMLRRCSVKKGNLGPTVSYLDVLEIEFYRHCLCLALANGSTRPKHGSSRVDRLAPPHCNLPPVHTACVAPLIVIPEQSPWPLTDP